ncbi:MAG: DUF1285 domain-containing protein, partial [Deltaproteobacteria bacterium]
PGRILVRHFQGIGMTQFSGNGPDDVFDATPYLKLVFDKEGRWFQNGAEIIHSEVYLLFSRSLERAHDGAYQVRIGKEICRVEVEDAPFVVRNVTELSKDCFRLELNDGTGEIFEPERFWIGEENVPYTSVKEGQFHARFLRPAYYELAKHIVSDADEKRFYLEQDGKRIPVRMDQPDKHSPGDPCD